MEQRKADETFLSFVRGLHVEALKTLLPDSAVVVARPT